MVLLLTAACNSEEKEAVVDLMATEQAAAEEVEEVEETINEEESLEKRLQHFLNLYSSAYEEGEYGKMYDMWENSIDDTTTEDYENNKADYISQAEMGISEGVKLEVNMDLVEVIEESLSYKGDTYIQMLVEVHMSATEDGEIVEVQEGLAHVYAREFNSKYGFIIDDDMEFLEE